MWSKIKNGAFKIVDYKSGEVRFNSDINPFITKLKGLLGTPSADSKIVLTAEIYKEDYHAPVNKYKDDKSEHLKDGDKFINISLQIGDYYITLATLPALKTIEKSFVEGVYNNYKSWVESLNIDNKLTVIGGFDINKNLTAIKPLFPTFRDISKDNSYQMHTISGIKKYFVGGEIEVIKLPTDSKSFMNLYNNNSSHTYYDATQLKNLFNKYKGTHAIKVSYGNGFSKIIPVFEKYHTLEQLLKIVNKNTNTRSSLKDSKNTGLFLGNKLLNPIQIENVYNTLTSEEKKEYQPILTKIYTQIFKGAQATSETKHKRSLKNIFRSHEVIGDGASEDVKNLRVEFINALIEDEKDNNAIDAFFNGYAGETSNQQIITALSEARLVNNFYKKLKKLTDNKFYVSVVLGNKIEESSQIDLVELGLSQKPEDNLVTGFIVETPKLLLNLEPVISAHKNSISSETNTQTTIKIAPNNVQAAITPEIVQSDEEIDEDIRKFSNSEQTDTDIDSLVDSFLNKED